MEVCIFYLILLRYSYCDGSLADFEKRSPFFGEVSSTQVFGVLSGLLPFPGFPVSAGFFRPRRICGVVAGVSSSCGRLAAGLLAPEVGPKSDGLSEGVVKKSGERVLVYYRSERSFRSSLNLFSQDPADRKEVDCGKS